MNDIRERLQETARMVETTLPPNTGYVLLAFDFGPGGRLEYASNAHRRDVVKMLREFIQKTESGWMTHQDDGPPAPTMGGVTSGESLGEALPREIKRCQELLVHYAEIGPAGNFGAMMIRKDIEAALKAIAEGDTVAMIFAYKALKGCQ